MNTNDTGSRRPLRARKSPESGEKTGDVEAVRRHVERWAEVTDRRLRAAHPHRPAWDECRRRLFVEQLEQDAPDLTVAQRLAVLEAFDAAARRMVVPAGPSLPPLLVPRVSMLVGRVDVDRVLDVT